MTHMPWSQPHTAAASPSNNTLAPTLRLIELEPAPVDTDALPIVTSGLVTQLSDARQQLGRLAPTLAHVIEAYRTVAALAAVFPPESRFDNACDTFLRESGADALGAELEMLEDLIGGALGL